MSNLFKIGDICEKFNITSRTLRYYEEIGLIQSTRNDETNYRYYDIKAVSRINQILMLRKLTFSIKEIQQILSTQDLNKIANIFNDKLNTINSELASQEALINIIKKIINVIKIEADNKEDSLTIVENIFNCETRKINTERSKSADMEGVKINSTLGDIRILKLRPMKVAYYKAVSDHPEDDAWNVMRGWVKENNLDELFSTRYFGFNNPDPSEESNIYGYEVWTTVTENIQVNDFIGIKEFEGGLYAVVTTNMYDIVQSWQQLYSFIEKSEIYKIGSHRWLEEHLIVSEASWGRDMQVDLYCPIELQ